MAREGIVKSEIKSACDILRTDDGTSGVMDYMAQLSWLLFLRIFEGIEEELEEMAILDGKKYIKIIDNKFRWSNWAHKDWIGNPKRALHDFVDDVDEEFKKVNKSENTLIHFVDNILFPYLRSLSGSPEKEKINEIFTEIPGNKMRSTYNFLDVIDKIDKIDPKNYEDTHVLSQFYEGLLLEMGNEAGWSGEFYTPRPIVRFMVKMVNPKIGKKIYDPFGGSGGFLVESFSHIKHELGSLTVQENEILQNETFFGQDKKPLPYLFGTMNLILHGILNPNFYRRNTLTEDVHNVAEENKYDLILTNPPFGGKENKNVQENFLYKAASTQALALQYVMRKLKDKGKIGIVLPEGQIMYGSGTFKNIRKYLLEKFNVYAIVSLPNGVFTSMGTGVKTNLLFVEKSGQPTKEIWYYQLEGKFSKSQSIKDEDLEDALNKSKKREISGNSWIVPIEEIIERDYDLIAHNPHKDENKHKEPRELLLEIEDISYEIDAIVKNIKSEQLNLFKGFKELEIGDTSRVESIPVEKIISEVRSGFSCAKKFEVEDGIPHLRPNNIGYFNEINLKKVVKIPEEKYDESKYNLNKGDVLFNNTNSKELVGRAIFLKEDFNGGFSNHITRIRVKKNLVLPEFLSFALNYLWTKGYFLQICNKWIGQAGVNNTMLKDTLIPLPSIEEQKQIIEKIEFIFQKIMDLNQLQELQLQKFTQLRESVLDEAFKGQL